MPGPLPDLLDPDDLPQATGRAAGSSIGSLINNLVDTADRIETEQGPFAAEFFRAAAEAQFRSRGIPFDIKSADERRLQAIQLRQAEQELVESARASKVREVTSFLLDNATTPIGELSAKRAGDTTPLQDAIGKRLDPSILDNPMDLVNASRQFAQEVGEPSFALSMGDLFLAGLGNLQDRVDSPEEARAKSLELSSRVATKGAEQVERVAATQQGDSALAKLLSQNLAAADRRSGQDVDSVGSIWTLGDDFDEERGAMEVVTAIQDTVNAGVAPVDEAYLGILTGKVGKRIASILRGASDVDPNTGERVIRRDDDEAVPALAYLGMVDRAAQDIPGLDVAELLRRMGVEGFRARDLATGRRLLGQ